MRTSLSGMLVLASLMGAPGAAGADASTHKQVDVTAVRDSLTVLRGAEDHYVVLEAKGSGSEHFYYGTGARLYRVRSFGGSADGTTGNLSRSFWAPRAGRGSIARKDGVWTVRCGERKTEIEVVTEVSALWKKAKFYEGLWQRYAYALSRDDRGRYYYVDRLRKEYGGQGFRLFVGPKGKLKRMRMTNIVSDSEGDIFSTKKGELRFILSKNQSTWIRGKKRTSLTNVPVGDNVQMIYRDLGVYLGELGTPCDHM